MWICSPTSWVSPSAAKSASSSVGSSTRTRRTPYFVTHVAPITHLPIGSANVPHQLQRTRLIVHCSIAPGEERSAGSSRTPTGRPPSPKAVTLSRRGVRGFPQVGYDGLGPTFLYRRAQRAVPQADQYACRYLPTSLPGAAVGPAVTGPMDKFPNLLPHVATAAVHSASVGIVVGVMGCVIFANLGLGALSAVVGFVAAGVLFGLRLWRVCHPRRAFLDTRDGRGRPAPEAQVEIR
jgi:hypothetical protein